MLGVSSSRIVEDFAIVIHEAKFGVIREFTWIVAAGWTVHDVAIRRKVVAPSVPEPNADVARGARGCVRSGAGTVRSAGVAVAAHRWRGMKRPRGWNHGLREGVACRLWLWPAEGRLDLLTGCGEGEREMAGL